MPEVVCRNLTVKAADGDNVLLQCYVRPQMNLFDSTVDIHRPNSELSVHSYRHGKHEFDQQEKRYVNRTYLNDEDLHKGIITLRITNVTPADNGLYWCFVPEVEGNFCTVNLIVGEFNRPR